MIWYDALYICIWVQMYELHLVPRIHSNLYFPCTNKLCEQHNLFSKSETQT